MKKVDKTRPRVDKTRPREDCISSEEIAALIERAEARSLKEGDGQIIAEVIRKTLSIRPDHGMIEQLVKEGKVPSGRKLRRLMAIPRPKKLEASSLRPEEKKSDE